MTAPARGGAGGGGGGEGGGGRGEGGRGGLVLPSHAQPKFFGGGETSPPDLGAHLWVHTEGPPPPTMALWDWRWGIEGIRIGTSDRFGRGRGEFYNSIVTKSHDPLSSDTSRKTQEPLPPLPGLAEVRGEPHQRRLPDDQATTQPWFRSLGV